MKVDRGEPEKVEVNVGGKAGDQWEAALVTDVRDDGKLVLTIVRTGRTVVRSAALVRTPAPESP